MSAQQQGTAPDAPPPSKITSLAAPPEVQLYTGSVTTSIPINVPSGRKNLTPALALQYTNGGATGPFGVGWDLPLGRIVRAPDIGALSCPDPGSRQWEFTLLLPGVSVGCILDASPTNGIRRCQPRVESGFLRIEYEEAAGRWIVRDKSGLVYRFERRLSSCSDNRLFVAREESGVDQCCWAAAWFVTDIEDPNGNYMTFTYSNHPWGDPYLPVPEAIQYGGNRVAGMSHRFLVKFLWEIFPAYGPPWSIRMGGLSFLLRQRLQAVEVREGQLYNEGPLVRSYEFVYEDGPQPGKGSRLQSVQLRGRGTAGQGRNDTPILYRNDGFPAAPVFLYSRHQMPRLGESLPPGADIPGFASTATNIMPQGVGESWSETRRGQSRRTTNETTIYPWRTIRDLVDMNADSFPDLVEVSGPPQGPCTWTVRYYRKTADGSFGFGDPQPWTLPDPSICAIRLMEEERPDQVVELESWSWVLETLADLNGDAVPDFVRVTTQEWPIEPPARWTVFLGASPDGATPGGFRAGFDWPSGAGCSPKRTYRWRQSQHVYQVDVSGLADINGDGLLDLVCTSPDYMDLLAGVADAAWHVWYNKPGCGPTTQQQCGFVPPRWVPLNNPPGFPQGYWVPNFRAPWPFLRRERLLNEQQDIQENGGVVLNDLRDMDGDGRPDAIGVWKNDLAHPAIGDSYNEPAELRVYRNTGTRFSGAADNWALPERACGFWAWAIEQQRPIFDGATSQTARSLIDVNGDGLADLVTACPGASGWEWLVNVNTGSRFAQDATGPIWYRWSSPFPYVQSAWTGEKNIGGQNTRVTTQTSTVVDLTGDGLADFLALGVSNGIPQAYHLYAHGREPSSSLPNDLLIAAETGIGGRTRVEYVPSTTWHHWNEWPGMRKGKLPFAFWTVSRVIRDDGLCTAPQGSRPLDCAASDHGHTVATEFAYASSWYEPRDREFRGFGEGYATDRWSSRKTFFHQDAVRRGQPYKTETRPVGSTMILRETQDTWQCVYIDGENTVVPAACPDSLEGDSRRWWARLVTTIRRERDNAGQTSNRVYHQADNLGWDQYGNVVRTLKITATYQSSTLKVGTRSEEFTTYWQAPPETGKYIADKPAYVETLEYPNINGSPLLLQRKWFQYDLKGNLVSTFDWLDDWSSGSQAPSADCPVLPPGATAGSGLKCVVSRLEYDVFGNLLRAYDALHTTTNPRVAETVYDSDGLYPVLKKNRAGHFVAVSYDRACGVVVKESAPSRSPSIPDSWPRTRYEYDAFCRLRALYPPLANSGDIELPKAAYVYTLGSPGLPTTIQVRQWVPTSVLNHDVSYNWLNSYQLIDSFSRALQTQTERLVGGVRKWVADSTMEYDSRGRVRRTWTAFEFEGSSTGRFVPPPDGTGTTTTTYDILDRPLATTKPDNTVVTYEYPNPWTTVAYDECWQPGSGCGQNTGRGKTVELFDGLGRVIERQLWDGETFKTKELFRYDIFGRVLETMQDDTPAGSGKPSTRRTARYDSLGRKIQATDPDTGSGSAPGVWKYGYDLVGNLVFQDDPKQGQSLRFSYDVLDRLVLRREIGSDSPACPPGTAGCVVLREHRYRYDSPATDLLPNLCGGVCSLGDCTLGRPTATEEFVAGEQRSWDASCYDARGRTRLTYQYVAPRAEVPALRGVRARLEFQYDVTDRPWTLVYPDGEVLEYWYDQGWLRQIKGSVGGNPKLYVVDLLYDRFGRATNLVHGNDVQDTFEFGTAAQNYRLVGIKSQLGSQAPVLSLAFTYWSDGLLGRVTDRQFPTGVLSNRALYRYDGLGHLVEVAESEVNGTYSVDGLRNLALKEGMSIAYGNANRPHQPTMLSGGPAGSGLSVEHDSNGSRTRLGAWVYDYDPLNRLVRASSSTANVQFVYGASGQRVATVRGSGTNALVKYSVGSWMDAGPGDYFTKYYYVGQRLVASQRVYRAWTFLYASGEPAVQVAGLGPGSWGVMLQLSPLVTSAASWGIVVLTAAALVLPQRRQKTVGVRPGAGTVLILVLALGISSTPVPIVVRSAQAGGSGGGGSPPPPPPPQVLHYHLDHLGSTQVLTKDDGSVLRHIRYQPYGQVRGYYTATGGSTSGCAGDGYCREFGGYETEATSGLLLAPARAYHPLMGMFLTHDPAGQYPNPYAYGPWNPVNGVDPTGAFFAELLAFIVSNAWWLVPVMSAAAVAIDVGIRTGSFGFALIAGLTTLATALATGWLMEQGLGLVAEVFGAQAKAWVKMALAVVQVPLGAYGAAQAADNGMVASAAVSAFLAALGAYALYRGLRGPGQGVKSQTQEEAKQSPGGLQFAENTNTNTATDAGSSTGETGAATDGEPDWRNPTGRPIRGCDAYGCGEPGASRGTRVHRGADYVAKPGQDVQAPVGGKVTRVVEAVYNDAPQMKGVVLETPSGYRVKLFYVEPNRNLLGRWVGPGATVGKAQDLSLRYPSIPGRGPMTNHVHIEIRDPKGRLVDPRDLIP